MTKCHQLSDMENVFSNHSGSQESGIKVSAGLVPFIWRGREYVTCFSSPFCWLTGTAWHSLTCVNSVLSLSLHLCIFSHHPPLPEFFLIETRPWLKDPPCTSGWSHLKISLQFQSSCFQVRFQPQVQGLGFHYICLTALFVYLEVLTFDLTNCKCAHDWMWVCSEMNASISSFVCFFFWGRVLCSPGLPQICYVTKDNPEFLTLLLLCLPVLAYTYELSYLICNLYVLFILLN